MGLRLTVIVSGCHSGPNPSPGLGIARALRLAYPSAHLIARDFSPSATGLHAEVFNEVWLCPPWEDAELDVLRDQLLRRLDQAWLISGLDLEVRWLAGLDHPRILGPPTAALREVAKPGVTAANRLPVRIPDWLSLDAGDREVHTFCRRHDWQVWVKGPAYESQRVHSWPELQSTAQELGRTWGPEDLFVQAHVAGHEVSVAFAAFRGDLLGAVFLEKLATTEQGKAWAGAISEVPAPLLAALGKMVRDLQWTGGSELEFVRDTAGELWLFDWNPRFPAWIHGATLVGINLPGLLLERASGERATPTPRQSDQFVRVVTEIPARSGVVLPRPRQAQPDELVAGKHPSGMPQLARQLRPSAVSSSVGPAPELPENLAADLLDAASALNGTPARVLLPRTAESRFALAARFRDRHEIQVAYSLKTNPDPVLLALAKRHALLGEVISREEIEWAVACGWSPGEIVCNGPVPLDPGPWAGTRLRAVFADTIPALARYLETKPAGVAGVRLRPPGIESRFGVPLDDLQQFRALASAFREAPTSQRLGVSFHLPSSEIGLHRWGQLARCLGHFATVLCGLSGRTISLVDLGGGWTPEDFDIAAEESLPRLARWLRSELGEDLAILIEPGKALVEPTQAVLTRVVDIRRTGEGWREAVLDGGVSLVPQVAAFPHRMAAIRRGTVTALGPGPDTLLGPSCMESDRLCEGVALPPDLVVGDLVAICDAGAYDASMSYRFGRGGVCVPATTDAR